MSAICIIDTSVYCNFLGIPNRRQNQQDVKATFKAYVKEKYSFLLPMVTIYETGNHIAQNGDGNVRRQKGILFKEQLNKALSGTAPWRITPIVNQDEIRKWLDEFPNWAMRGSGFGDLAIKKIYDQQCQLHPTRHVFIWTYDEHLKIYDRVP